MLWLKQRYGCWNIAEYPLIVRRLLGMQKWVCLARYLTETKRCDISIKAYWIAETDCVAEEAGISPSGNIFICDETIVNKIKTKFDNKKVMTLTGERSFVFNENYFLMSSSDDRYFIEEFFSRMQLGIEIMHLDQR